MVEPLGYPPNAIKNARERERNTTANDIVKWHFWQFQTTQQFPHTRFLPLLGVKIKDNQNNDSLSFERSDPHTQTKSVSTNTVDIVDKPKF
jgi:hypothetical protein